MCLIMLYSLQATLFQSADWHSSCGMVHYDKDVFVSPSVGINMSCSIDLELNCYLCYLAVCYLFEYAVFFVGI